MPGIAGVRIRSGRKPATWRPEKHGRSAILFLVGLCLSVTVPACGRRKLRPDGLARNQLFAEILCREDRRILGEDDFFPRNLAGSRYPEVREWCAIALGRIGNPRALPWLYSALHSGDAAVRAAAAFAVGEIEDREALKTEFRRADPNAANELRALLGDPSLAAQSRAVEALGKIGGHSEAAEIAKQLEGFTYDGSPAQLAYADLAITALMRLKDEVALPVLRRLAASGDPAIQWRAANALIRLRDQGVRQLFLRMIGAVDADLRAYAARGLGICGDPTVVPALLPLLPPFDPNTREPLPVSVRASAVLALGSLKDPSAIPAIAAALEATPITRDNPDQMNFAIQAAGAFGSIGSIAGEPVLLSLLNKDEPVANSAVVSLARVLKHDPDRFFASVPAFRFTSPAARRAWAAALGELGGPQAIQELKRMLLLALEDNAGSPELMALPAVLSALAKADAADLDEIIRPFLTSHDPAVMRAALAAYRPRPGAREPWVPLLEAYSAISSSLDPETKVAALDPLEPWIGEKAVQETLRAALKDRVRNARIVAARLLRMARAADVPDDPGPSESAITDATCRIIAAERRERTVAILETTRGTIEIELFRQDAPLTVANFVSLAKRGFFDGLSFMRVVPFFVIQGGDPRNDQEGGPGYSIRCEINRRPFVRGSLGMALAGKDTGGSQFFITLAPQPHLDGGYTCFGRVIAGMPLAERIVVGDRIKKVRIEEDVTALDHRRY